MGSKVNIKEGGHEDNEVAEIFLKFKGQISNLPEEFGTLSLQEGVQRFEKGSGSNEPERVNPQQHALAVAPLNSMPYIGPPTPPSDVVSTPPEQETEAGETVGPAMIFLPSHSTEEELNNLVDATRNNNGVLLTGSAAMGQLGPIVGLVDIWESEDSYVFRVSLPGVSRDEKDFSCDVDPSGKITIKGVTTTGEKVVCKYSQVFTMMSQNMPPPGHFSVEFELPGPVNNHSFTGNFGIDGILEGIVKKS